ncbi:uncharacterized protein LTR77_006312 [Saxophila tyrrhenica]|uniref:Uncharacterized protein n=1 Tax=Saxophila tyrrhenica TaxID=1690608 RepID=A0AAV9P812_9PEZI|nr:hypothetical protein LTR77_006312 [Saxophila tyrrhenica]
MALLSSTSRLTLDLPPSCIAFCPSDQNLLVVGTYFLHPLENRQEKNSHDDNSGDAGAEGRLQKRSGSLILYRLEEGSDVITQLATKPVDYAVLDIQWSRYATGEGQLLAVATSTGQIAIYRLPTSEGNAIGNLELCSAHAVADPSILVLYLAWHPKDRGTIGYTLSDGTVGLCSCGSGNDWRDPNCSVTLAEVHSHSLEAWTLTFNLPDASAILSGGDDAILKSSTRIPDGEEYALSWQDRKIHQAGVTAILPLTPTLTLTGSYDDHIRLIASPATGTGRRKVLAEANLGGGVWRLKMLDSQRLLDTNDVQADQGMSPPPAHALILASCMHAGTRMVRLSRSHLASVENEDDVWQFEVLARFEEHESMNYASDAVVQEGKEGKEWRVVSTSFYDRLMCSWRFELEGRDEVKPEGES